MFKLKDLSLSFFAIIKEDETVVKGQPFVSHGFVHVLDCEAEIAMEIEISDELRNSGELEELILEAIQLTREYIDEEFAD